MNEDKYCLRYDTRGNNNEPWGNVCEDEEHYNTMLDKVSVVLPPLRGELDFTYTSDNTMVHPSNHHYNQLLDYILYRDDHLIPNRDSSYCTIIQARDQSGNDLSDHYPVTCEFQLA